MSRATSLRKERIDLLKRLLLQHLGGCCAHCGTTRRLEVNHIDGTTWVQRPLGREQRWLRYLDEVRSGVRINLLCRSCNAAYRPSHQHEQRRAG